MRNSENYRPVGSFKKRSRFRFWLVLGLLTLFLAACIGGLYFVINSPWLNVKNVTAADLPGVSSQDILNALKVEMLQSRVRAWLGPDNIFFWQWGNRPETISGFPALKDVSVQTDFWDRSVDVTANERRLWGVVCGLEGSACYGLDENGVVFSRVPDVSGSLLLRITDVNGRSFLLGQPIFSRPDWFVNFKNTIESMNRNGFRVVAVKSVNLSLREWAARTVSGPDFYFSLNSMPDNFDSVLKGLSSEINLSKTSYVDFRVPNRIYYR